MEKNNTDIRYALPALDIAWNSSIEMVFSPDSRHTTAQQNMIEQGYHMQDGILVTSGKTGSSIATIAA